jgi:hypothetical protein
MNLVPKQFFAALTAAGLPEIPEEFSVVPFAQMIPAAMLLEIENFIRLFDRVTTSAAWQEIVTAEAPEIARLRRSEVCFFTAWDFHLSLEEDWQLIECNDNGSGFLFAALINRLFYDHSDLGQDRSIEAPPSISAFAERLAALVEREAKEFFGALPLTRCGAANSTENSFSCAISCVVEGGQRRSPRRKSFAGMAIVSFWTADRSLS